MNAFSPTRSLATRHFLLCTLYFTLYTFNFSCQKLNEIRVVGRNFEDEIQMAQNLVFTFNKDLVRESDLNSWEAAKYVEFKPAVAGKFKWTAPNELVFSPTSGFDPATEYRAELKDALTSKMTDKKYGISSEEVAFHTPFLQLTETETYWTKSRESGKPLANTKLQFNYDVNSNEVNEKLEIKSEEKILNHSSPVGGQGAFLLPTATGEKNEQPLTISLQKGVKVANTNYESKEVISVSTTLPSPFSLEVTAIKTGFENNRAFVKIVTTQELQPENLANYYTIQPALETKAELTDNGFIVRGNFNEADTYVLTITNQTKGVLGASLSESVSKDLFFGKMPSAIGFVNKKATYLSAKGARNVGVNIVNLPKVRVKIAKVYQNNILPFLRGNRYENYSPVGDDYQPDGTFN